MSLTNDWLEDEEFAYNEFPKFMHKYGHKYNIQDLEEIIANRGLNEVSVKDAGQFLDELKKRELLNLWVEE